MGNKNIIAIIAFSMLVACKSVPTYTTVQQLNSCATDFSCKEKLSKNSAVVYTVAEYGNSTATITENEESMVVEITRDRIVDKNIQDASYREHFLIEMANPEKTIGVSAVRKFIFGKFCFCKGEAGYFEVKDFEVIYDSNGKVGRYTIIYSVPESRIQKQKIQFELK
jgi:hypothetical protein